VVCPRGDPGLRLKLKAGDKEGVDLDNLGSTVINPGESSNQKEEGKIIEINHWESESL
jgi:hypothetical protein